MRRNKKTNDIVACNATPPATLMKASFESDRAARGRLGSKPATRNLVDVRRAAPASSSTILRIQSAAAAAAAAFLCRPLCFSLHLHNSHNTRDVSGSSLRCRIERRRRRESDVYTSLLFDSISRNPLRRVSNIYTHTHTNIVLLV